LKIISHDKSVHLSLPPQALAPFGEALEAQHIREDILPSFVDLTRDDQDSVRLIAGKQDGHWELGCCMLAAACGA
jgi:hypothetical protein